MLYTRGPLAVRVLSMFKEKQAPKHCRSAWLRDDVSARQLEMSFNCQTLAFTERSQRQDLFKLVAVLRINKNYKELLGISRNK